MRWVVAAGERPEAARAAALLIMAAACALAPAALILVMPVVLGVPHVVSDVRFLVLPLPRR